jgi:uncharacterized protein YaaN involved in tellurite resistance
MNDSPPPTGAPAGAPEVSAPITLQPPDSPVVVTPDQALGVVKLSDDDRTKLDGQVATFTDALLQNDVHSDAFRNRVDAIAKMADDDIAQSAAVSNRMLDRPTNALNNGALAQGSDISKGLLDLRKQVEALDPSRQDLTGVHKLLGLIPFGSQIADYFRGYESAQTHLNAIIEALYRGKDELQRDDAAIDQEKQNLWDLMGRLEKWAYLAQAVDAELSKRIDAITDPARKKILQEEALFGLRQKRQDIATQMAVDVQGYMALDLVRRNNVELIKGVDRATTTTVSALRTAVIVAQALTNQKLVLDQISALNATTNRMIEATSELLKDNSAQIAQQAASSTVSVASLQKAFDNIFATLDTIDTYKIKALDSMEQTVTVLEAQVQRAKPYLDRERQAIAAGETSGVATKGALEI